MIQGITTITMITVIEIMEIIMITVMAKKRDNGNDITMIVSVA